MNFSEIKYVKQEVFWKENITKRTFFLNEVFKKKNERNYFLQRIIFKKNYVEKRSLLKLKSLNMNFFKKEVFFFKILLRRSDEKEFPKKDVKQRKVFSINVPKKKCIFLKDVPFKTDVFLEKKYF